MSIQIFFRAVLVFVLLIGGTVQYLGLVSNTVATVLISGLFLLIILFNKSRPRIKIDLMPYVFLSLLILFSGLNNGSSNFFIAFYAWSFALVPFSISKFISAQVLGRVNLQKMFDFFIVVGIVQLPVLLIQQFFAQQMILFSARPIAMEDVAFGTFFFSNDHALSFFILSLIVYLLFDSKGQQQRYRWLLVCWYALTIVLVNSNTSFLLLVFVLASYIVPKLNIKTFLLVFFVPVLIITIILSIPVVSGLITDKYNYLKEQLFAKETTWEEAQRKIEMGLPQRSDILMYYERQDLKILGDGPFNYFDPLKGQFNLFKNFSQYLWFYNDLGLWGLAGVLIIFLYLYFSNCYLKDHRIIFLILILIYSLVANTLSDLAFNIIFSLFILKDSKQIKRRRNEHRLYTIPRLA